MHDLTGVLLAAPQVDQAVLGRRGELRVSGGVEKNSVAVGTDADADDVAIELGGEGGQRDRGEARTLVLLAQLCLCVIDPFGYYRSRTVGVGRLCAHAAQSLRFFCCAMISAGVPEVVGSMMMRTYYHGVPIPDIPCSPSPTSW